MIRSLTIENYRGFRKFELHDLGRVNLIVGTNNAGKTSVLEAIHILESPGEIMPIWATQTRRGEDFQVSEAVRSVRHIDVCRLFHGHEITVGNQMQILKSGDRGDRGRKEFHASIIEPKIASKYAQVEIEPDDMSVDTELGPNAASLLLLWGNAATEDLIGFQIDLTRHGGLSANELRRIPTSGISDLLIRYVSAGSLSADTVINFFEDVVLTPFEDFVIEALRIIEPSIERIAPSGTERRKSSSNSMGEKGGLFVKCKGMDRIPIGSMGDGIWRILGLALSLAKSEGGILLIDEIDTGLHYSVMEDMWKLVTATAKKHNIQVFATTHSRDCVDSLAAVCRENVSDNSEVTIQRIEREKNRSVAYTEQEIIAAATHGTEVR